MFSKILISFKKLKIFSGEISWNNMCSDLAQNKQSAQMQTTTTSPFALADHVLILVLTYDWEWEEKKVIFIIQTKQIPLQLCKSAWTAQLQHIWFSNVKEQNFVMKRCCCSFLFSQESVQNRRINYRSDTVLPHQTIAQGR